MPRGAASSNGVDAYASDGRGIWYSQRVGTQMVVLDFTVYYFQSKVVVYAGQPTLFVSSCVGSTVPCPVGTAKILYSNPALPTDTNG